jgi:gentisate 1,2-dioxygenase
VAAIQDVQSDPMGEFYRDLHGKGMDALWRRTPGERSGKAPYPPYLWKGADLKGYMQRAGELVRPGPAAERRVILLQNPAVDSATHTLTAALQMVLPGEIAPSHRHTAAAIRFVMQGSGTVTLVDGEPCSMNPGDLILTPGWTWHGHINQGDGPMIWMDSLDAPMIGMLKAMIQEPYGDEIHPATVPVDASIKRWGNGALRPTWSRASNPISPLLSYPWAQTETALHELAQVDASPFDDVSMEYTNPSNGGHVLPTIACWIQMLRPGVHTMAHRHTTCQVYHVFRGSGSTIVDGVQIDWEQGDFFALPPRCWHEHLNASSTDEAILFSTTDTPVFEAINLYLEEPYSENGGRQPVTGSYSPPAP